MMMFIMLSSKIRACFMMWAFMLCVFCIVGIIYAFLYRKTKLTVVFVVLFLASYMSRQVIYDLFRYCTGWPATDFALRMGGLGWFIWATFLFVITLFVICCGFRILKHGRNHVTQQAIMNVGDEIAFGLCYWRDNGHVIYSNRCINDLCIEMTGEPLLNGNYFLGAITEHQGRGGVLENINAGGKTWKVTFRNLEFDGEALHELTAQDVSEIYAKTRKLRQDNARLSQLNRELKEYNLNIDEAVRKEEILQAKVTIHDEMNRLLLLTTAAEHSESLQLDALFDLWARNALLLCREADAEKTQSKFQSILELARILEMEFIWDESIFRVLSDEQKKLLFTAAQEAVSNAAKHAKANTIRLSYEKTQTQICCIFENDGNVQKGEVHFAGGLANLKRLAAQQNAVVKAEADTTFRLSILFGICCLADAEEMSIGVK